MTIPLSTKADRARLGWVRRASAVAMARGTRRPLGAYAGALGDVRMGGIGSARLSRPDLVVDALLRRD